MKRKDSPRSNPFTLLEILIVLAIMGLVSGFCLWEIRDLGKSKLQTSMMNMKTTLRELQILALATKTDMCLNLTNQTNKWQVRCTSDEPIAGFTSSHQFILEGVDAIWFDKRPMKSLHFVVRASGRIEPTGVLRLDGAKGQKRTLDLSTPLQIKEIK